MGVAVRKERERKKGFDENEDNISSIQDDTISF